MKHLPPLNDSILIALSRLIDDAQTGTREPSHSDIEFCITRCNLNAGDPKSQGQTFGKAKRVRTVLSWSIEHHIDGGRELVERITALVRGCGGFRRESPNYVGEDAIIDLRDALASEGFVLSTDGELRPQVLESLAGVEMTEALSAYARRAQKGSDDAALLAGTSKDLLEATAAHVVQEVWNNYSPTANFPTLLGQAFAALGLKTTADQVVPGEPPQHRLHRGLYEAACAINKLRNKQGTGHGRPWVPSVTAEEARQAVQVMGTVTEMLLTHLKVRK
jgi:Abortive infection C-terminus